MSTHEPPITPSINAIQNLILRKFNAKCLLESIFHPSVSHISKQALSGWAV